MVEIHVYEDEKLVEFWMTKAEQMDETLQQHLHEESAKWIQNNYKIVIFRSGRADLKAATKPLISCNFNEIMEKDRNKYMQKGA